MRKMRALVMALTAMLAAVPAVATAPLLYHTPGYESPVRADPDDLLLIPGWGFKQGDRVVYRAMDTAEGEQPGGIPKSNSAIQGTAPIVQQGEPYYSITIRLPAQMTRERAYRLWVVTARGEWSDPIEINDPRPQWVSPAYVYSSVDLARLGRVIRVVGRNLRSAAVRVSGSGGSYLLESSDSEARSADESPSRADSVRDYVLTAHLPAHLAPGLYSISVHRPGLSWIELPEQKLEVLPDPTPLPTFTLGDPQFGACRPDDSTDDSDCFTRAIEAAASAGGGIVFIPPGQWDLTARARADGTTDGFIIPRHVQLKGAGSDKSLIVRHGPLLPRRPDAMLTLVADNTISGIGFSDEAHFDAITDSRPVIQLGSTTGTAEVDNKGSHLVRNIVITENSFLHIGRGIIDEQGRPIARLMVTANRFGAYSHGIDLPGNPTTVTEPFRIDDSIVRGNRFVPGSYLDLKAWQGPMATGMGAGHRVDVSANVADGTSTEDLQDPRDPSGWRAGHFWNLNNSVEMTLISANKVSCSGDKDGDGEAIAFDSSGDSVGFVGAPSIEAAGPDWVSVRAPLIHEHAGRPIPRDTYYVGHWLRILDGPGLGQTRRIVSYTEDAARSEVILHVTPKWDVPPAPNVGRAIIGRQYWQVYVVGNDIDHRAPPCHKANLHGPYGGKIVLWAPTADLAIEGNQQRDANGIQFNLGYSTPAPSCPNCGNFEFMQANLEIRGNRMEGEYDWNSDCSEGGIRGEFGASPTPESPPPITAFGISISHNWIEHSDGPRGGGIVFALAARNGPPPGRWDYSESLLIFHNHIQDMTGPAPSESGCRRWGQKERSGIRLEGEQNFRGSVLYGNRCERVDRPLVDGGLRTLKLCDSAPTDSCECGQHP